MNRRTRVLVEALRRLPRPETPSERYLAGVRRELPRAMARVLLGPVGPDVAIRAITVPGSDTLLPARVYRRAYGRRDGAADGDQLPRRRVRARQPDRADWLCGQVAARAGVTVVSVGYRLAPEYPAPMPFLDSWTATQWLISHAGLLRRRPAPGQRDGRERGRQPGRADRAGQPRPEPRDPAWPRLVAADPGLSRGRPDPLLSVDQRTGRRADAAPGHPGLVRPALPAAGPPRPASPPTTRGSARSCRRPHRPAPTLIIAAGEDPLRDDAIRYAEVLRRPGSRSTSRMYESAIHGFLSIPLFEPTATRRCTRSWTASRPEHDRLLAHRWDHHGWGARTIRASPEPSSAHGSVVRRGGGTRTAGRVARPISAGLASSGWCGTTRTV